METTTTEKSIFEEIEELLAEPVAYDPACPDFGTTWTRVFNTGSAASAAAAAEAPRPAAAPPLRKNVPTVGCMVQRSDHQHRRKMEWLTTPPPPRPARRITAATYLARKTIAAKPTPPPIAPPAIPPAEPPAALPAAPPAAPPAAEAQALRPVGPRETPKIPVLVEPGHIILVPHGAVHNTREWKTTERGYRWHVRFNHEGTVRKIRKLPAKPRTRT
ncbi:lysine-rich arabinogalactan protein 19-like [Temnothorax curvispinosus]|uniref:Lysine-rich arabinogalactan protein 19-like n=1 Tax=Temnothorax curvispinosus TaxID=300111 RepID=A0A6J1R4V9_9HYME|nr:lysine-rich arabinogalactan protein 19-like [Temnothorax curvispinosus]